jgi:predicted RNase H-like HicB family nuclease
MRVNSAIFTLDELQENIREVIEMLLEEQDMVFETEFVGTQQITIF